MKDQGKIKWLLVLGTLWVSLFWFGLPSIPAAPIQNSATGSLNGASLDLTNATVSVNRVSTGLAVDSVLSEISPNVIPISRLDNNFIYDLLPTINGGNTGFDLIAITIPPGYSNILVTGVSVGGISQNLSCPSPGNGQYCSSVLGQVVNITFGTKISTNLTKIQVRFKADAPGATGIFDVMATVDDTSTGSVAPQANLEGNADGDAGDRNSLTVFVNQGIVLELTKTANKKDVVVGDVVTYQVDLKNTRINDVVQVQIEDRIPPNFKFVRGSTLLNGSKANDPSGNRTLVFDIGTVPGWVDSNGNGDADPGEPGHIRLSYQLIVGSGASPGEYINSAVSRDVCDICLISNIDDARVAVVFDPIFDLGTIIGKVFEDLDQDGWQDEGELGVEGVMVVLDNGTFALTDEHGRYHFPAILPGQRLIKINLLSIPGGATITTRETQVKTISPGLLAKVNFGLVKGYPWKQSIGRPAQDGLRMDGQYQEKPIELLGNVENLEFLFNGRMLSLPSSDIQLGLKALEEMIYIEGGRLEKPVEFKVTLDFEKEVSQWHLTILNAEGEVVRNIEGMKGVPQIVRWDALSDQGELIKGGEIYQYQMDIEYADGSRLTSPRRIFGVNQSSAISLSLTGGAFDSNSVEFKPKAREALSRLAKVLREYPKEKIVIEGHADSIGSESYNLLLSKRRTMAAVDYLVQKEGVSKNRFIVRWFGETRPIASNEVEEGRELNRRVELKGEINEVKRSKLFSQYQTEPTVQINHTKLKLDPQGRFSASIEDLDVKSIEIDAMNTQGQSIQMAVRIPSLEILEPGEKVFRSYGKEGDGYIVHQGERGVLLDPSETIITQRLLGRTEPGNLVDLNGEALTVDEEGFFSLELSLKSGENHYGILVQNPSGFSRITHLTLSVSDRDQSGKFHMVVEPIPNLSIQLPPKGSSSTHSLFILVGKTDPENTVKVNGREVPVEASGKFSASLVLPKGKNQVRVEAIDPEGYTGIIEGEVNVTDTQLFFLAFADGEVGQLMGRGYLQGANMDKSTGFYTQGRLAYYLKGVIAGKYLITSAFDSGKREFNQIFKDLDKTENDRLLTNLDPDKLYPVYGDDSTLVYDTQSQGKFYLALDSEVFHALVGNFSLNLTDTELAAYQRTLYGGKLVYQSASQTKYGQPDTQITLFGAEVHQTHVRNEIRATGGSLYYLSQGDVIEGSEQVTLMVRDKNTGLLLNRIPQLQNSDYSIKYEEGRLLFNRPISSVVEGSALIDQEILSGNPVFIQVDYEARQDSFEKTGGGGRIRQQVGDNLSLGMTYIHDELEVSQYELKGLDTEVRFGKYTRFIGEYVESRGTDGMTLLSEDGGLTFNAIQANGSQKGNAWKVAADLDVGEWFDLPNRFQLGGYFKKLDPGFVSNGNIREQGSTKRGVHLKLKVSKTDRMFARYDHEEFTSTLSGLADIGEISLTSVQWRHHRERWELIGEFQGRERLDMGGNRVVDQKIAAARFQMKFTEKLKTYLEHQETISGPENDQTTIGVDYQLFSSLMLQGKGTYGSSGRSAQGGAVLLLGKSRLYLTERLADDQSGQVSSTILGGEANLSPSAKIYSEYQWEKRDDGDRTLSLIGAQKEWNISMGLRFHLSGEHAKIISDSKKSRRYTIATGFHYSHPVGLKASTRGEVRREEGDFNRVQYLTTNHLDFKLSSDFTLLGKIRYSLTRDLSQGVTEAEFEGFSLGLAYRPVANDRFNFLARYTRLKDMRPSNLVGATEASEITSDVASMEWSFEFNRFIEWVEKDALKIKREKIGNRSSLKTHTILSIHRVNFHVWRVLDLGLEYRLLTQREANDIKQGWLSEVTWELAEHLRLGVGYNFTDFSDNEYSDNDYSVYGWFFRFQAKF